MHECFWLDERMQKCQKPNDIMVTPLFIRVQPKRIMAAPWQDILDIL